MASGRAEVACPFCKKVGVKAFHKPSYLEQRTSHISAGRKTQYCRVPESYDVVSACLHCGKSRKDIEQVFGTGVVKERAKKMLIERLDSDGRQYRKLTCVTRPAHTFKSR
jgi:hypothetical protein